MERFLLVGLCRTHKSRTPPLQAGFLPAGKRHTEKKAPQFAVTSRTMVCFRFAVPCRTAPFLLMRALLRRAVHAVLGFATSYHASPTSHDPLYGQKAYIASRNVSL